MEWGYRRVRELLRKLRVPGSIEDDELARTLQALTGALTARDAVVAVAERALRVYPPIYWTIVRRVDIEGDRPETVAAAIHQSERSFFRSRAAAIAAVAAEIAVVTRSAPPRRAVESVDVLALVSRGRYLWKHRTTASLQRAARCFERALEIDPRFARAYAGLADVHLLMGEFLVRDPVEAFADARLAVESALELDPTLPELHATLADLHLFARKDLRRAKESCDFALSIDPSYSTARHCAAWHAMISDNLPVALEHLRAGLAHAPDALELQTTLGVLTFLQGSHAEGVYHLSEVLELDPDFSFARCQLARALVTMRRYDEALGHLDVLSAAEPREMYSALAGYASARTGDPRPARRFLGGPTITGRPQQHYLRAYAHMGLGETADVVSELQAAVLNNEPWTSLLPLDGLFAELRDERAFRALRPFTAARG